MCTKIISVLGMLKTCPCFLKCLHRNVYVKVVGFRGFHWPLTCCEVVGMPILVVIQWIEKCVLAHAIPVL